MTIKALNSVIFVKWYCITILLCMVAVVYAVDPYDLSLETYNTAIVWSAEMNSTLNMDGWTTQVTSFNGNTYVVYVDVNRRPKVVKITAAGAATETFIEGSDYAALSDGHHKFSIGVDEQGYIHVTGDMHNYPSANTSHMPSRLRSGTIMYWRSDNKENNSAFTWKGGTAGECPDGTGHSYGGFFNDFEGRLFFTSRSWSTTGFEAGKKDCASLHRYDPDTAAWTNLGAVPPKSGFNLKVAFWEDNAETGTTSYARVQAKGVSDVNNRIMMVANLLNSNSIALDGTHVTTDAVYIQSVNNGASFTRASGSAITLPARVEAGANQGDVLVSYDFLGAISTVAVDQNLTPHVMVKTKAGNTTLATYTSGGGWANNGWNSMSSVSGNFTIVNDSMGVMTIIEYTRLHRFWSWDESKNVEVNVGKVLKNMDIRYLQTTGDIQGVAPDGTKIALVRTGITRPKSPEIVVLGNGQAIMNNDNQPGAADDTAFGHVAVGSSLSKTFTIENAGDTLLRVFDVTVDNADFTVINQPAGTVTAGNQTTFTLKYQPASDVKSTAWVHFGNNHIGQSRFSFAVSGNDLTSGGSDDKRSGCLPGTGSNISVLFFLLVVSLGLVGWRKGRQ